MQINSNSWHYKLYSLSYSVWNMKQYMPDSTNLCQYCRHTVISLFFAAVAWSIIVCGLTMSLSFAAIQAWHHPSIVLAVVGRVLAVIGTIAGIFAWLDSETIYVFNAWWEAKTKGICPLIEFTTE